MRSGFHVMDKMRGHGHKVSGNATSVSPISESAAVLYGVLFTVLYVAPFYISPTLRTSSLNSRDSPTVIKARVRAVLYSCLASTLITIYVLANYGHASSWDILRLFGIWPTIPFDCVKLLILISVLFAGPLFETVIVDAGWRDFTWENIKIKFWTSPTSHRNVVVAPWCEELVFRSLVISLFILAEVSPTKIVFTSPLIFGVAHVHHFIEILKTRTPPNCRFPPLKLIAFGALASVFQLMYTSIFGFFAAFVFLRTGNVFAGVVAHTFCNFMGLPRLYGRLGPVEIVGATPDVAQGKPSPRVEAYQQANSISVGWTVAYYALLFVGAYGFYELIWPLTESNNALVIF